MDRLNYQGVANNRLTDRTRKEVEKNLLESGFTKKDFGNGKAMFEKDGEKYFLRDDAKTHDGPTADYYPRGSAESTLKIRLQGGP